jgi:hypothetical protein
MGLINGAAGAGQSNVGSYQRFESGKLASTWHSYATGQLRS